MRHLIIGLILLVGCSRSADPLLGTWVTQHGRRFVFHADGRMEIHRTTRDYQTVYWKARGNRLELFRDSTFTTPKGFKSLGEGTFHIDGDTLELSQGILIRDTLLSRKD